jgi:fumarylacetoacetase
LTDLTRVEIPEHTPFPIENLPLGVGTHHGVRSGAWVALGDHAVDLAALQQSGALDGVGLPEECFSRRSLNRFLSGGPGVWSGLRQRLTKLLAGDLPAAVVVARSELRMGVPVRPRDYVDFYSSLHHATNIGRIFRPDGEPLLPNWRHLPVGYHGRAGTLVASGTAIVRPDGLRLVDGVPVLGPSSALDIELEVGTVIGVGNPLGHPIPIGDASGHLYGMCLVNDWSARDIQSFEYQPLGPFLGKSFATSVSPWLVSFEALAPYRIEPPRQDPPVADYLRSGEPWGFDLHLEVFLQTAAMCARDADPVRISEGGFADMYWTPDQQLAHLTINGASTSSGDVFASGTVSGTERGTEGSLIELAANGERPIELLDGSTRTFLEDGDTIILRGWAGGSDGSPAIGLGSVSGTIHPRATVSDDTRCGGD